MARLQILQLPEGANDDRPPFILVVDQYEPQRYMLGPDQPEPVSEFDGVAERIGARMVLVFAESIDIPANDPTLYSEAMERAAPLRADERAIQAEEKLKAFMEKRYAIEQDRKASLTDALGMDRTRDWDDIRNAAAGLRKDRDAQTSVIERVRNLSTEPELMNSEQEHPRVWRHGYECGVRAAKSASRPRDEEARKP